MAHFLNKKIVEDKIQSKEFKHEVINVGKVQEEYISKYILDLKVDIIAKEYRFYKDEKGKYNIPKEFYAIRKRTKNHVCNIKYRRNSSIR